MTAFVDKTTAIEIANRFLRQHFSVVHMDAVLEGKTWLITAQIELFGNRMLEKIRINRVTGQMDARMLSMESKAYSLQSMAI